MNTQGVTIGNATLFHGDSFDVLPKLDMQADAVISDPPFACTNCSWDIKIPLDSFWTLMETRTKLSANYILFAMMRFAVDLISSKRKWYRYDMIWQKNNKVGFLNANLMPMRNHELVLVFGRPGYQKRSAYNPQKEQGGKPGKKTINHRSSVYRDKGEYTHVSNGFLHPHSILSFNTEKHKGLHPTQKPIALMEWLVQTYTNEGDTVIDPFMGSGTTGVACAIHNRRFIGIERDERYFEIAVERISRAYVKTIEVVPT